MDNSNMKKQKIITVCGKGGVGKTSISALLVQLLAEDKNKKILAIDADPAIGLAYALDIQVEKTVDDIRTSFIDKLENGDKLDRKMRVNQLDFEIASSLVEKDNIAFLAIGRPETDGCYCSVNDLLRDIIKTISDNFDYIIIDAEAGVEQVNRRVMELVTHLLLVSDTSAKSRRVVKTIEDVSKRLMKFEKSGLIMNRMQSKEEFDSIKDTEGLHVLGYLPEDSNIRKFDKEGLSFFTMEQSIARDALRQAMDSFLY